MPVDFTNYIREDNRSLADESSTDKLRRAAYAMYEGTSQGFADEVNKAMQHPGEAALKFGLAAAAGVGLSALQSKAGLGKLAAETAAFSMGCAFATDVALKLDTTTTAFSNAYNGKEADFTHLGKFAFDTTVMTAGGMTGVLGHRAYVSSFGAGRNQFTTDFLRNEQPREIGAQSQYHVSTADGPTLNYQFDTADIRLRFGENHIPVPSIRIDGGKLVQENLVLEQSNPVAKLYQDVSPSVLKIGWKEGTNGGTGTAVVLEGGWLATAHHCVKPSANGKSVNYYALIDGAEHPIYPVWKDVSADLALLRLKDSTTALPKGLQLGWASDLKAAENLNAFGFPADANRVVMTKGPLVDVYAKIDCPSSDVMTEAVNFNTARLRSKIATWTGNSGGPIVTNDGKVVGIHTSGIATETESYSSAIEHLHVILNRARNTSFGSGPVNEVHAIGRVIGKPGELQFKVKVDALNPNWLRSAISETVQKPGS